MRLVMLYAVACVVAVWAAPYAVAFYLVLN